LYNTKGKRSVNSTIYKEIVLLSAFRMPKEKESSSSSFCIDVFPTFPEQKSV
jgi:hypothetical protein